MLYRCDNPHGGDIYGEEVLLDFSANTNPFGTPAAVLEAITQVLPQLHHYPDPYCRKLVAAIAAHEQVEEKTILCGNGAAELIYAYCEAVRPRKIVELAPTFSEYALAAQRAGCQVSRYRLKKKKDFSLDVGFLPFLETEVPDAVFLCNPNNPTGRLIPPEQMEKILSFCKQKHIRLFVDECFLDLSEGGQSLTACLPHNPHLFILKAFTKSYGMAGVRLGYGMSSDHRLLEKMARSVQPWNVSILAQEAGVAALKESAFLQQTKDVVNSQRRWLQMQLEDRGFWVCPGCANYLLFQAPEDLHEKLRQRKIAIRNCANYPGLGAGWYRIAVRLPEENQYLIKMIKEVLPWQKTL